MSGIGGWFGGGAAIIVVGLCYLLMKHGHNLPSMTHPWQHRAVIIGMLCAGTVLAVSPAGQWIIHTIGRLSGYAGGTAPGSGIGWALVTLGALFLAAGVVVALIWAPDPGVAYIALLTPLVLALAPSGFAHQLYVFISVPAQSLVSWAASWAGG